MRTVFELKVWQQDERSCFFLLLWDHRREKLTASLPYPEELQKRYQLWRRRYYRFYRLSAPPAPGSSGRLNPGSGDPAHDLTEAEKALVKAFHRWLGAGDIRNIQQQIRDELARLTQAQAKATQEAGVDVLLACDSDDLARLPWELWPLAPETPGAVRIVRTAMDTGGNSHPKLRSRKARILAVLGHDPNLPLQQDWKAVRSLQSMAHIEQFRWQPEDTVTTIKQTFAKTICDRRGWDVLFFAGHSDETAVTGGRIAITPTVSLSISEIEESLTQARENGLQLAIFNSCSGLSIANALVGLGLQVVVMREPIRNDVAQSFLKPLCQQLAQKQDIHSAVLAASHHLKSAERFAYPSTHLIPSFFSPAGAISYRLQPFGWQKQLQQWWPTSQESLIFTTALLLTIASSTSWQPFKTLGLKFLDRRIWAQAIYRKSTGQMPQTGSAPVLLVAIDQDSINQAGKARAGFQHQPMDREYLADLIQQLSDAQVNVIGIDYLLDEEKAKEEKLAKVVKQAVKQQGTWFVFGSLERDNLQVREQIASSKWSLSGDVYGHYWQIKQPFDATCAVTCPFAYLLSLAKVLNHHPHPERPQPSVDSPVDLQQQLHPFLNQLTKPSTPHSKDTPYHFLKTVHSSLNWPVMIDYSIPPESVYQRLPAWQLLDKNSPQPLTQSVAIIAAGGYFDAVDKMPIIPALQYWCNTQQQQVYPQEPCPRWLTGGEIHAYNIHHFLLSHRVVRIPDLWMVLIAGLLGKWAVLTHQQAKQQQRYWWLMAMATATYGLISLQSYIWANVLMPWLLPSAIVWAYLIHAVKKKE